MASGAGITDILKTLLNEYSKTPLRMKILDVFLVHAVLTAAVQFLYMLLVGTFPFNSFLAGLLCSLGFFSFTLCLRMQVDPTSKDFEGISPERAFADYVLACLVLFIAVWNYMG